MAHVFGEAVFSVHSAKAEMCKGVSTGLFTEIISKSGKFKIVSLQFQHTQYSRFSPFSTDTTLKNGISVATAMRELKILEFGVSGS
jgi:hypothetical protein